MKKKMTNVHFLSKEKWILRRN